MALLSVPTGIFAFLQDVTFASVLLMTFIVIVSATIVVGTALFTVVVPNELRGLCVAILFAAGTLFGLGLAPLAFSPRVKRARRSRHDRQGLALVGVTANLLGAAVVSLGSRYFPPTAARRVQRKRALTVRNVTHENE